MNETVYRQRRMINGLHTALLLGAMGLLLGFLGWALMGVQGIFIVMTTGILILALSPHVSTSWTMRMLHARPLQRGELPALGHIMTQLSARAGLEKAPQLYLLPTAELTAFTSGHEKDSGIALSSGLLRTLDRRELISVLAHEISHVANGDVRVMALASHVTRLTRALSIFGFILVLFYLPLVIVEGHSFPMLLVTVLLLAPHAGVALQLAMSRTREYAADAKAAALTGDPRGLACALNTLEEVSKGNFFQRLFFPGPREAGPRWLRTHPDSKERIKRLLELDAQGMTPMRQSYASVLETQRVIFLT